MCADQLTDTPTPAPLDAERLQALRALAASFSGLQYVVTGTQLQWPWTSVAAANQVVDLVRVGPDLLARIDALTAERDALQAAGDALAEAVEAGLGYVPMKAAADRWRALAGREGV